MELNDILLQMKFIKFTIYFTILSAFILNILIWKIAYLERKLLKMNKHLSENFTEALVIDYIKYIENITIPRRGNSKDLIKGAYGICDIHIKNKEILFKFKKAMLVKGIV